MPNPTRRSSTQRRDKRRTHYKGVIPAVTACPQCGAVKIPHRVCPECGYYNGRKMIASL
jgi:large subunit ribosomal protein L32